MCSTICTFFGWESVLSNLHIQSTGARGAWNRGQLPKQGVVDKRLRTTASVMYDDAGVTWHACNTFDS